MKVEIKENCLLVEISELETEYLKLKAVKAGFKDVASYVKARVIETLGLESFENVNVAQMANEFDLKKIKDVTKKLKQSKSGKEKSADKPEPKAEKKTKKPVSGEDDLLTELLDKDLLEGRRTPKIGKKDQDLD